MWTLLKCLSFEPSVSFLPRIGNHLRFAPSQWSSSHPSLLLQSGHDAVTTRVAVAPKAAIPPHAGD